MERLEQAIESARIEMAWHAKQLENTLRSLSGDLSAVSTRLAEFRKDHDERDIKYVVNSLGEVQGMGGTIDVLCARFDAARAHLKVLLELQDSKEDHDE